MKNTTVYKHSIEITDLFGGEANYSWVRRMSFLSDENLSDLTVVRRLKKLAGWDGAKCDRESYGESIVLKPRNMCQVAFITSELSED